MKMAKTTKLILLFFCVYLATLLLVVISASMTSTDTDMASLPPYVPVGIAAMSMLLGWIPLINAIRREASVENRRTLATVMLVMRVFVLAFCIIAFCSLALAAIMGAGE